MSKVFVIPDVHLKPWIFDKAEEKMESIDFNYIVLLGDIVDDWNQERNINLYIETLERVLSFISKHPDTLYCYGNHDLSYPWEALESGYSAYAHDYVVDGIKEIVASLPKENVAYIHRIDNVLFSHAGLTESFVRKHFGRMGQVDIDYIVDYVNKMGKAYMWQDDSPIWARPQYGEMRLYPMDMLQVVGHTPVVEPTREDNLLTVDTFSTYRDGSPIGDETFVVADTETMEYEIIYQWQ